MSDSVDPNDLGDPSSYMALEDGTPVFSSDGRELGSVHHVLADMEDCLLYTSPSPRDS